MKYVFDSNIFITLQQRQPLDLYPTVWEKISDLMYCGIIISSQEVLDEITAKTDELSKWAKKRNTSFYATTEEIQLEVRNILKEYRELVEGGKKKNTADPFIIALAKEQQATIVTEEGISNNIIAPKIPDVCSKLNVPCINFVAFCREMKFSF